jgi:hypothetical protein
MDQTKDVLPEASNIGEKTFFWIDHFTAGEIVWGFAVINLIFWLLLSVRMLVKTEFTYYAVLIVGIAWFIAGFSAGAKYYDVKTDHRAVVLEGEADIMAGPDTQDTVLFKLHAGAIVHRERKEDGWSLIRLSDDKRGWIQSESIETIASHSRYPE